MPDSGDAAPARVRTWTSGVDPAQQRQRPRRHGQLAAGLVLRAGLVLIRLVGLVAGLDQLDPAPYPLRLREREFNRFVAGVEHHVKAVVEDLLAALVRRRNAAAVQEHAERLGERRLPILFRHLRAARREPADVADPAAVDRPALEPAAAAEHGMAMTHPDQAAGELQQIRVGVLPVVPRDLAVLAVAVVVALLGAAD